MSDHDDFEELNKNTPKRQYLITYSQADEKLFPTRKSFGEAVEEEFNSGEGKVKVEYWAVCREPHKNTTGFHYHCSIKLSGAKKWLAVRNRLESKYGIDVNFSNNHDFYLSSYRYVCKEDEEVVHSKNHPPNLLSTHSPKTKSCIQASKVANRKRRSESSQQSSSSHSKKRLSNMDAAKFIKCHEIKTYESLLAFAEQREIAGQNDLSEFVYNRSEKHLQELIKKSWQMKRAEKSIESNHLSRMEVVRSFDIISCSAPCNGKWLEMAKEILKINNVPLEAFSNAIKNSLEQGRGKHRNVLIVGPASSGKTFILKPLKRIFKDELFENPANNKYGWVGVDKARCIFLNDFRWDNSDVITWKDFLLLLEGETVKLPAPKNFFAEDIVIHSDSDVPIFCTSKGMFKYKAPYGVTDDTEDKMMKVRWKVFKFHHEFEEEEQITITECPTCFCNLIFRP